MPNAPDPVVPAPAAPAAQRPPAPGPQPSAVEAATAEARARIARGEPLLPTPGAPTPPAPEPAADPADEAAQQAADAPPAAASEAPPDGEPEGEPEAEADPAAPDPDLVVELLPRDANGEPVEIVVDSRETAERLRQTLNGAMRREEFEARTAELEQVLDRMDLDPAEFLLGRFADQPAVVDSVVMYALTRPDVWKRLGAQVLGLQTQEAFDLAAAKAAAQRYESRDALQRAAGERAAVQRNLREVQDAVQRMIPADAAAEDRADMTRDLLLAVKGYADQYHLQTVSVQDLPLMVSQVLRDRGLDPLQVAQALSASTGNGKSAGRARRDAPAPARAPATPAKSGKQFLAGAQRRAAAARVAPAGAGARGAQGMAPPPNQSIEERIAWHKAHKGRR